MPTDNEWPLKMCKVKEAWKLPLPAHGLGKSKGEGIIIVHPDTGWTEHPELLQGGRYLYTDYKVSRNFLVSPPTSLYDYWDLHPSSQEWLHRITKPEDRVARDTLFGSPPTHFPSHGTATASFMISEQGHPNKDLVEFPSYNIALDKYVTGVAPLSQLIPCRVTRSVALGPVFFDLDMEDVHHNVSGFLGTEVKQNNKSTISALTDSIYHAVFLATNKGFNIGVISISLGSSDEYKNLSIALMYARRNGIIICAAAGQLFKAISKLYNPVFPGKSPHAICIAGCDEEFNQPPEGFYGREVAITAPGWGVIVAKTEGPPPNYVIDTNGKGSSYSTAFTAGACALWQAYHNRGLLIKKYGRPLLHDLFKHVLQQSSKKDIPGWKSTERGLGVINVEDLLKFPLPVVSDIEKIAHDNGWEKSDWGDENNWGRETII